MKTERLFIMDIEVGERHRSLDPNRVGLLKASIQEIGLRTPITVSAERRDDEWAFRLVAGRHRMEAMRQLGEELVDVVVMEGDADDAELWEIDENFARAELTDAQRADHHVRREEILKRKGLVATHGGARKQNDKLSSCSYAERAAADLGVDKRTVQRDLARGKKIAPEVLREADDLTGSQLDELARTSAEAQPDKLVEIRERRSSVKLAADPLNDPEAHEKQLAALMSAWNRAAAIVRQEFLLRVDQPVFDNTKAGRAA